MVRNTINLLLYILYIALNFNFFFPVDGWGLTGACSLIVVLGTLASLASLASSIVVYKDWVAIMADGNTQKLASESVIVIQCDRIICSILYTLSVRYEFDLSID